MRLKEHAAMVACSLAIGGIVYISHPVGDLVMALFAGMGMRSLFVFPTRKP